MQGQYSLRPGITRSHPGLKLRTEYAQCRRESRATVRIFCQVRVRAPAKAATRELTEPPLEERTENVAAVGPAGWQLIV